MKRVLFVCLGNICRSPAAEGVLKAKLRAMGIEDQVRVESCGTGDWHVGELPDARMRSHAKARGYELSSRARQLSRSDFDDFDLIVVMDESNYRNVLTRAESPADRDKVVRFVSFLTGPAGTRAKEVPDPYYGEAGGFDLVLDLLEEGCEGLIEAHLRH